MCGEAPSLPVASLGTSAGLRGVPCLLPFQDLENKLNTKDTEARKVASPTLTKDFSFQERRPVSTVSVGDPHWSNKGEGCRRGGISGAQNESARWNTTKEGEEEQKPRDPGEKEPMAYSEEVTGRGEKDNDCSNTEQ
ncbi:hypothetical protein NDU88_006581 [Pleurodeles waltl]|uniref:Uncharacterized protein n=1 Tax=Pleurodeles waltl TaxID=8319 RepID=A0AAV7X1Y2_PLEWA|nr:hypothetical protein NDU88_006581 [Pleurodeles waltl]